ncbi:beta-galactosidase [Streptosporangiaceae bacterium NEAU-GS5]|nr:beta-galactosidase [Streptosporangiaceae bacterium NEAU-GS5]
MEFRDGVAVIDGEPRVLVTADYPYYRDDPAVWADRLRAVRDDLGIEVITSYIPWRHHQPDPAAAPDFTTGGRDVVGYLALCEELGLKVIAKPGPFIHAEVAYGGLPDWICPDADPCVEPLLDAYGQVSKWGDGGAHKALPAPLGTTFLARVTQWLSAVGKEVIGGPVVALQIANEGIYTNGSRALTAYDYSPSGLAFFRERLTAWYGTLDHYNRLHGTAHSDWTDARPGADGPWGQADWGRFHAEYMAEVYRVWAEAVGTRLPVVININPPTIEELDDWLARVRPELWGDITYGFTNWMGVVSAIPDSHARYVIAAKRAPGPNMEENWGFAQLYDPAYADGATSLHQTLLALAAGATGFNIYTGVSTSGWTAELDVASPSPYPDHAPIAADGTVTEKAAAVKALADFFALHGPEFLECAPVTGGAFGLYLPYAGIAALGGDARCGAALRAYHGRMRAEGRDYALLDLSSATLEDLAAHASLTVPGGPFMHREVQELLAAYAAQGGAVTVDGPVPLLDENLTPCDLLSHVAAAPAAGAFEAPVVYGSADAYIRIHPERDVQYVTVLVQDGNDGPVGVRTPYGEIEVVCAKGGAAVIRIVGGLLDDVVVKGVNGYLNSAEVPRVSLGGTTFAGQAPGDLVLIGRTIGDPADSGVVPG